MAFAHIHHAVAARFAKADDRALAGLQRVERGPAARARRGKMRGEEFAHLQLLRLGCEGHALGHELAQRRLVGLLQLAPAAGSEMATGRFDMV